MAVTTIQVEATTRARLGQLKTSPRETYDELLNRLVSLIPEGDEEGLYTQAFRMGFLNARLDLKAGRLMDHESVKRRLGL